MKNSIKTHLISIIVLLSSFVSLVIDEVFKPFLEDVPEVKLVIILIGVLAAYHEFLLPSLSGAVKEAHATTDGKVDCLSEKNAYLHGLVPFSHLDEIERQHGYNNIKRKGSCEIWVIANNLQESSPNGNKDAKNLIHAIYDNITKYRVRYYYILPDTYISKLTIDRLSSSIHALHQKKKRTITGDISYKYDSRYANVIPSEYFDIVLFIDCDSKGNPTFQSETTLCEGYYCFSNKSTRNVYFYQKIETPEKLFSARKSHSPASFEQMKIQD